MQNKSLVRQDGERLFVTSLDISNRFGKQHKNVLQAIENLECSAEFRRLNFQPTSYNRPNPNGGPGIPTPMVEITRDGFSFLCMGFTGAQAAVWKERYIAAFNQMETALRSLPAPAPELPAVTRSPRLEGAMQQMAQSMATLADGMQTVIAQTNMTKRYISLLEMNQTGKQAITPRIREEIFRLSAEGMNNADIARLLRVSRTSVSLIVRGRYMETAVPDAPLPAATAHRLLEDAIERERAALEREGGVA